jgi:hypothetical protein
VSIRGVGDAPFEAAACVAELESVGIREVVEVDRVRIRHIVELRVEPHLHTSASVIIREHP